MRTLACLLTAFTLVIGCGAANNPQTGVTVCATVPTQETNNPRQEMRLDENTQNDATLHPGSILIIPANGAAPAIWEPENWACHNTPVHVPGRRTMRVDFEAPISGPYSIIPMVGMHGDSRHGRPLIHHSVRMEDPGHVTCYFTVEDPDPIDAISIVRQELHSPEPGRFGYEEVPVNAIPRVEIDGRSIEIGERRSYPGAYITMLR